MNSQSTSFIPQRPTQGKAKNRGVRKIYILSYISYVLFFGTLLAASGTFFYKLTLGSQLTQLQEQLTVEKNRFSQSDIESVRELDKRISLTKERMNQHISVLSIFETLEKNAIQSLQFVGFSYVRSNDLAPVVSVTGRTENFNSVLFQREVLAQNPILAGANFSETTLSSKSNIGDVTSDKQNVITFVFEKAVDPASVGYMPRFGGDTSANTTESAVAETSTVSSETSGDVSESESATEEVVPVSSSNDNQ